MLFNQITELIERFESHLVVSFAFRAPSFHPGVAESCSVAIQDPIVTALQDFRVVHPSRTLAEHVVVGQGQKVVAFGLVPVCNHLRELIAVTPQRMRVDVSLPLLRCRFIAVTQRRETWNGEAKCEEGKRQEATMQALGEFHGGFQARELAGGRVGVAK